MRILALGGSLREASKNRALLEEAAALTPTGTELDFSQLRVIGSLPLFNQDLLDREGQPGGVAQLKDAVRGADGLLIATPEYNWGIPGFLKNGIDWASRPSNDIPYVFGDLPVALIGAGGVPARASRRMPGCRCSASSRCGPGSVNRFTSSVLRSASMSTTA